MTPEEWNEIPEHKPQLDYPAAARAIALWLKPFCDESLDYPNMIADAARKAANRIAVLEDTLREVVAEDMCSSYHHSIFSSELLDNIYSLLNSIPSDKRSVATDADSSN